MAIKALLGWILSLSFSSVFATVPHVVVSIKPLHSLVAAVMQGVGEPDLLVEGNVSAHHFALKPSDAAKLRQADWVVLVAPNYETGLSAFTQKMPPEKLFWAMDVAELTRLPWHEGGEHAHDHHDHDHDHTGQIDPHFWLDVKNAEILVKALAKALSEKDPEHFEMYHKNAAAYIGELMQLDKKLHERFSGKPLPKIVVFHDAYQYLSQRYGVEILDAVLPNPELPTSAKHLMQLRTQIKEQGVRCIFSEPQFTSAFVENLAETLQLQMGVLDPIGAKIAKGPGAYGAMMLDISDALLKCHKL